MCSETLTVRENLLFSANIRLSSSLCSKQRIERVNRLIEQFDLQQCADTLIGTDFIRGISSGEKKRTNIAMELIHSPHLLFLDEPTTGLSIQRISSISNRLFIYLFKRTRCFFCTKCDQLSVLIVSTRM